MNLRTTTAYLIFFFQGITTPMGYVMIMEIAEKYHVDMSFIGYILTIGIICGSAAVLSSGKLIGKFSNKVLIFSSLAVLLAAAAAIALSQNVVIFTAGIILWNIGTWALIAVGNYLIISQYTDKARSSQLNVLNFTYSAGALIAPTLAGFMLESLIPWEYVFITPFLTLAALGAAAYKMADTVLPESSSEEKVTARVPEKWNMGVYLSGIALGMYCVLEGSYTSWIVVYLRESIESDIVAATFVLTTFFVCQAIGRLVSGWFVRFIPLGLYIVLCAFIGLMAVALITFSTSYTVILVLTGVMALGVASLYPSILSYGTMQLKTASPKVVTFFILSGISGSIISMLLSSFLKQNLGTLSCIITSGIAALLVMVSIGATLLRQKAYTKKRETN